MVAVPPASAVINPPEEMIAVPPPLIVTSIAVPPLRTTILPPLLTMPPSSVPPERNSVLPLSITVPMARPWPKTMTPPLLLRLSTTVDCAVPPELTINSPGPVTLVAVAMPPEPTISFPPGPAGLLPSSRLDTVAPPESTCSKPPPSTVAPLAGPAAGNHLGPAAADRGSVVEAAGRNEDPAAFADGHAARDAAAQTSTTPAERTDAAALRAPVSNSSVMPLLMLSLPTWFAFSCRMAPGRNAIPVVSWPFPLHSKCRRC